MSGAGRAADNVAADRATPAIAVGAEGVPADPADLREAAARPGPNAAAILALQQTAGNRLTARALAAWVPLIQRQPARTLARQRVQTISGRYVGDLDGAQANVREDVLVVMDALHTLWSMPNSDYATEYPAVQGKPANERLLATDIPLTIRALVRNRDKSIAPPVAAALLGITIGTPVADSGSNAKSDVLALQDALHSNWNLDNAAYARERAAVEAGADPVSNGLIPETLEGIARFKAAVAGGTSRRGGPLGGTHIPTAAEDTARDAALVTPGAGTVTTVVGGRTTTTTAAFQDVVNVRGRPTSYRDDLWQAMDHVRGYMFRQGSAMLGRGRIPMTELEGVGDAAKEQVDRLYGANRMFGPRFHAGVNLLDASARPGISARSVMTYLVDNQRELGVVRARHNADHSRPAERTIADNFINDYLADATRAHEMEVIDQTWPALNEGGIVSIQPFEGANERETRRVRWEAFQTMIHEYWHTLTHPNFYRIAHQLGGDRESVLVEGGASVMTDHTWSQIYPGVIASDGALRRTVEGRAASFEPGVIPPISRAHYHPQFEQCRQIEAAYGPDNFRVALIDGRTELIGYPMTSPASSAGATGTQTFIVPPTGASTLADVAFMTASPVEEIARLNSLPVNSPVRPGQTLLVPGRS